LEVDCKLARTWNPNPGGSLLLVGSVPIPLQEVSKLLSGRALARGVRCYKRRFGQARLQKVARSSSLRGHGGDSGGRGHNTRGRRRA
jgi:hypothetical protein